MENATTSRITACLHSASVWCVLPHVLCTVLYLRMLKALLQMLIGSAGMCQFIMMGVCKHVIILQKVVCCSRIFGNILNYFLNTFYVCVGDYLRLQVAQFPINEWIFLMSGLCELINITNRWNACFTSFAIICICFCTANNNYRTFLLICICWNIYLKARHIFIMLLHFFLIKQLPTNNFLKACRLQLNSVIMVSKISAKFTQLWSQI